MQYFNCPSCIFKNCSKQEIVSHAYECHPESVNFLTKISDNSLSDIICPWNDYIIKEEILEDFSNNFNDIHKDDSARDILSEIKIEETNLVEAINCKDLMYDETIEKCAKQKNENYKTLENSNTVNNIKISPASVRMIRLSESQLNHYLNVLYRPTKTDSNVTEFPSKRCEICKKIFSSLSSLKMHIEVTHKLHVPNIENISKVNIFASFSEENIIYVIKRYSIQFKHLFVY